MQEDVEVLRKRDFRVREARVLGLAFEGRENIAPRKLRMCPVIQEIPPGKHGVVRMRGQMPVQKPKRPRVLEVRIESVICKHRVRERRRLQWAAPMTDGDIHHLHPKAD